MGSQQSTRRRPQKFQLTPPRIFLMRKDFFVCGKIRSGILARRVTEDFLCPEDYLLGTTLLLSEQVSEDIAVQCDADIAVGRTGPYANGAVRAVNNAIMLTAEVSDKKLELAAMTTPNSPLSLFALLGAAAGTPPELSGGFIWRPTFTFGKKEGTPLDSTEIEPGQILTRSDTPELPLFNDNFSNPTWKKSEVSLHPSRLESAVRVYAKKRNLQTIGGSHLSLYATNVYADLVTEYDLASGKCTKSDMGISWLVEQGKSKVPNGNAVGNLEVGLALRNFASLFDNYPRETRQTAKLTFSFYKHLVVPRKILIATDSRYKLISNYIDLGFELELDPRKFIDHEEENVAKSDVDIRFGASWQINKNNLVKAKVDPNSISMSYTFKSWWKPRASLSGTWTYNWKTNSPSVGLWFVLDTVDKVEHETAHASFQDSIGNTYVDYVAEDDEFL